VAEGWRGDESGRGVHSKFRSGITKGLLTSQSVSCIVFVKA